MFSKMINEEHESAVNYMRIGDFNSALSILLSEYRFNPNSIPILIDLSSCYYMVKDYLQFKNKTLELLNLFDLQKAKLDEQELKSAILALVKLLEEIGEISKCIEILNEYQPSEIKQRLDWKILGQKLRLNSMLNIEKDLVDLYNFCVFLDIKDENTCIDLVGGLIQADWKLFGLKLAENRLKSTIKRPNVLNIEKRLLIFDFVYEGLRRNLHTEIDSELFNEFIYLECDPFEQFVWDIYSKKMNLPLGFELDLYRLDALPVMGQLKIIHLVCEILPANFCLPDLRRKMEFLLTSVSIKSRNFFLKAWSLKSDDIDIVFNENCLYYEGLSYSIKNNKNTKVLLELIASKNEVSSSEIVLLIWECSFDEYSYSRLRTLVSRTNSILKQMTGIERLINMNKSVVKTNSKLKLSRANEKVS